MHTFTWAELMREADQFLVDADEAATDEHACARSLMALAVVALAKEVRQAADQWGVDKGPHSSFRITEEGDVTNG